MKSDLLPDPGLILIHSHIINNKVGGLRRIKGQRVSDIMIRVLYEERDRVRLHFFRLRGTRKRNQGIRQCAQKVNCREAAREAGLGRCLMHDSPCGARRMLRAYADPCILRPLRKLRAYCFCHRQRKLAIPPACADMIRTLSPARNGSPHGAPVSWKIALIMILRHPSLKAG